MIHSCLSLLEICTGLLVFFISMNTWQATAMGPAPMTRVHLGGVRGLCAHLVEIRRKTKVAKVGG